MCGADLDEGHSFVQEFWVADQTRFLTWCHSCHQACMVTVDAPAILSEPEH